MWMCRGECAELPATDVVELAGKLFYLVHSVEDLDINPVAAGVAMVVSGHSHKASIEMRGDVMYLNPGSAGPRRFSLPVTVGLVTVEGWGGGPGGGAEDRIRAELRVLPILATMTYRGDEESGGASLSRSGWC